MTNSVQVLATYGGYPIDPYWEDVLVLFDCDATRFWAPVPVFATSAHGWVVLQIQDGFPLPDYLWYHSATADGTFEYTGKTGSTFGQLGPRYICLNSQICLSMLRGQAGPIVYNDATIYQIPVDIQGSPSSPGQITTNIPLKDPAFIASNGSDFYMFGSISAWTTPNQVYKSMDNGQTWTSLGVMSGTTFPIAFGGVNNFGVATVKKIGSRWFMVINNSGFAGSVDGRRVFYTDSTDPVTGWTAATGINIAPADFNDKINWPIAWDGTRLYITRSRVDWTIGSSVIEIYRSDDFGATWVLDYTQVLSAYSVAEASEVTDPTPGGLVRFVIVGPGNNYWLKHVIGSANGQWTQQNYNNELPVWSVPPVSLAPGSPYTYIDSQNSGGISMGSAFAGSAYVKGALTYTDGPTSNLKYNGSPYYLYSKYYQQLAGASYTTRFAAYPLSYIDTAFYKWGTVPGVRGHNVAAGSLRCAGGRAYSKLYNEWNFGSQDWTIEFWMYTNVIAQSCTIFNNIEFSSGYGTFNFMLLGGDLSFFSFDTGGNFLANFNSPVALPINQWNFVTAVRSGGTIILYLNGISVATSTFSPSAQCYFPGADDYINFGGYSDNTNLFDGWLDDIRVTKGVARYNSNFAPPIAPFPERGPAS